MCVYRYSRPTSNKNINFCATLKFFPVANKIPGLIPVFSRAPEIPGEFPVFGNFPVGRHPV